VKKAILFFILVSLFVRLPAQMLDGRTLEVCPLTGAVDFPLPLDTAFLRSLKLSSLLIVRKDSTRQIYFDSARYSFDASGRVSRFKEYWPHAAPLLSTCTYANDGELFSISKGAAPGVSKRQYEFDQQQHFVRYIETLIGPKGLPYRADTTIRTWSGDTLKSESSRTHQFRYSWGKDTLSVEGTYKPDPHASSAVTNTRKYVFDANGRMVLQTGGTTCQYVYDGAGRLIEKSITGCPGGQSVRYRCFYNADGSLEKITYSTSGNALPMPPGTGEMRFYYEKRK
jgi:YD repeat-containing protein